MWTVARGDKQLGSCQILLAMLRTVMEDSAIIADEPRGYVGVVVLVKLLSSSWGLAPC